MSIIAVLITDLFEDVEYTKPAAAFINYGHQLIHIGIKKDSIVKGKKDQTPVTINESADSSKIPQYDALFIPGGYSPDKLRANEAVVKFVRDFLESGKPIFAICHAPQLLITANVLKGRKVTGYKSIIQDIKNAGALFIDKEVVEDGNLISSRGPSDIPAFIEACLQKLKPKQ